MSSPPTYFSSMGNSENLTLFAALAKAQEDAPYFAELGRFVVGYASAEASLHELARKLSKLSDEKARIIFGGMRLGDITYRIRQMMLLDRIDKEHYDRVDECIIHLDKLADIRGKLVHRLVSYEQPIIFGFTASGHFRVTDEKTAKAISSVENEIVTLTDLTNMKHDCIIINLRLLYSANPKLFQNDGPENFDILQSVWRYKPSQPKTRKKKTKF